MRAARLHEIGGTPRVDEIDAPDTSEPVRVSAAALNPVDVSIAGGRFYGGTPERPYVIGSEAVGTTVDGRRVWVQGRGLTAELVDPSGGWVFDVPEGLPDGLALACGIAGLTAWTAVSVRARVEADDTVLVLGASGTLGGTAVQAAKLLGARRVIGAARRIEAVPAAADETFDLREEGGLPPATLIVDGLWGEPFERALAAAPRGVRVVQLGQSAGPVAGIASGDVRGKVASILGHTLFAVPEERARTAYRELCEHVRDGRIAFRLETYPLAEIEAAWARQASGSPGAKILLEL